MKILLILVAACLIGCAEEPQKPEPSFDNPQDIASLSPAAQVACVFRLPAIWIGLGIFVLCLQTTIDCKRRK